MTFLDLVSSASLRFMHLFQQYKLQSIFCTTVCLVLLTLVARLLWVEYSTGAQRIDSGSRQQPTPLRLESGVSNPPIITLSDGTCIVLPTAQGRAKSVDRIDPQVLTWLRVTDLLAWVVVIPWIVAFLTQVSQFQEDLRKNSRRAIDENAIELIDKGQTAGYRFVRLLLRLLLIGIPALCLAVGLLPTFFIDSYGELGNFGDLFGVANALFSAFALCAVIFAIVLQTFELKYQRTEMHETQQQLRVQANHAALSTYLSLLHDDSLTSAIKISLDSRPQQEELKGMFARLKHSAHLALNDLEADAQARDRMARLEKRKDLLRWIKAIDKVLELRNQVLIQPQAFAAILAELRKGLDEATSITAQGSEEMSQARAIIPQCLSILSELPEHLVSTESGRAHVMDRLNAIAGKLEEVAAEITAP